MEIELYKILTTRFSVDEAETIIAGFGQKVNTRFEESKNEFATKEDLAKLQLKIAGTKGSLEAKIAEAKADIIKWMFIFWIGQFASFIALYKFFFHQ